MEELNKTHKEEAFGWVKWVQELSSAIAETRREREAAAARDKCDAPKVMGFPDDLHHLAAPH